MAMVDDLYRSRVDVDLCTDFEPLEVKVPLRCSGTVGFPPPMEGRYLVFIPCNLLDTRAMTRLST